MITLPKEQKERPILFNSAMVLAILDGRKTQTRRVLKPQPPTLFKTGDVAPITNGFRWAFSRIEGGGKKAAWPGDPELGILCPYGKAGDRLWVREAWAVDGSVEDAKRKHEDVFPASSVDSIGPYFRATEAAPDTLRWRPSIHMPRWASRLTLEVTGVHVEPLLQIRTKDAEAEGCPGGHDSIPGYKFSGTPIEQFSHLWDSINGKRGFGWATNPWVWVLEFKKVEVS